MTKKARTQRNTSGLRNQQPSHDVPFDPPSDTIVVSESVPIEHDPPEELDPDDDYGPGWNPHSERVGLKPAMVLVDDDLDGERDEFVATEEMLGQEAAQRWVAFAEREGDRVEDDEWMPPKEKRNKEKNEAKKKSRPTTYVKTVVYADMSERTQRRHKHEHETQRTLFSVGMSSVNHNAELTNKKSSTNASLKATVSETPTTTSKTTPQMSLFYHGFTTLNSGADVASSATSVGSSISSQRQGSQFMASGAEDPPTPLVPCVRSRSPSIEVVDDEEDSPWPLRPRLPQSSRSILEDIGYGEEDHDPSSCAPSAFASESHTGIPVSVTNGDGSDADYAPEPRGMSVDGEGEREGVQTRTEAEAEEEADEEEAFLEAGGAEARPVDAIRSWEELRDEIKKELKRIEKKKGRLTQINQLLILRNFATLRIKGLGRMDASEHIADEWHECEGVHFARQVRALARHFQLFEQLPIEKRGGDRGHSLLSDERVQAACRQFLTSLKTGEVTPARFRKALNERIFPMLGISLKKPISERTARRWLVKLGWRRTMIRKGVYMDGHERPDVVKYRNEVFLPLLAQYERRMVQFVGPELRRVEPELAPGEKRIIAVMQDESSMHAGEYKSNIWVNVSAGERKLMKKSRGRLIHVSDFVEEENGRLVVRDKDGNITRDARKIIYPGSNGDPWWDHDQLLKQVEEAIDIFEEAHPDCTALFIFDQSSAHATLGPDALRAFDMNKSNGGKQRVQHDTIIPDTNPTAEHRGKHQKMTTENGEPKGLEAVLKERGFDVSKFRRAKCAPVCPIENTECCMARVLSNQDDFKNQISLLEKKITGRGHLCMFLPKFHCELNPIEMYWGFVKYRYREIYKEKFEDAKKHALECLNCCPVEVIRRFFNRSWRFMDAYRKGLTGKAAEWAVRKQKSHRTVSRSAMMNLDAVLNQ